MEFSSSAKQNSNHAWNPSQTLLMVIWRISPQAATNILFSSMIVCGGVRLTNFLGIVSGTSMGYRFGEFASQSTITSTLASSQLSAACDVRAGAPSCLKIQSNA
jgi:hypothetical protein